MITAVDTSVLIAIYKGESSGSAWLDVLESCRRRGELRICDIVAAELFALVLDDAEFTEIIESLGLNYDPVGSKAAKLAGRLFNDYRRRGGPRRHLIPDFLIGAHAMAQADQLAAVDRGYLKSFFDQLTVTTPASPAKN